MSTGHNDRSAEITRRKTQVFVESPDVAKISDEVKPAVSLPVRMVISAVGGMAAATVCHPIDVIRINMQVFKYGGVGDAITSIVKKSGVVRGLYPGLDGAYLRQWTYGSCRMGIYSFLQDKVKAEQIAAGKSDAIPFYKKLAMGCTSGAIGSFVGNPCELAMVRLSADAQVPAAERRGYKNAFDCILRITKEEGVAALWTGATPTVLRAMLLSSSVLACYSESKEILCKMAPAVFQPTSSATMFTGTTIASFIANLLCTPFDVIKSRLQTMPKPEAGQAPRYSGMVDCMMKSVGQEGPMVVYRGFTPALVKLAPYTIISLMVVDKVTIVYTGKSGF